MPKSRAIAFFVFVLLPVPVDPDYGPLLRFPEQQIRQNAVGKSIDRDVERPFRCPGMLCRSLQVIQFQPLQILRRREIPPPWSSFAEFHKVLLWKAGSTGTTWCCCRY